jgi:hypothetical protein
MVLVEKVVPPPLSLPFLMIFIFLVPPVRFSRSLTPVKALCFGSSVRFSKSLGPNLANDLKLIKCIQRVTKLFPFMRRGVMLVILYYPKR